MTKNNLFKAFLLVLLLVSIVLPNVSFAQVQGSGGGCTLAANKTIGDLFAHVSCLIYKTIVPMFFALAVALFLWGVVQYVISEGDEGKREKGKLYMVWGLIGLTVMISVWALVAVIGSTFGLDTSIIPSAPKSQ